MRLITGEYCNEFIDPALVNEYNELTHQLNRNLVHFSNEEVIAKYNRIQELTGVLGLNGGEQLTLF